MTDRLGALNRMPAAEAEAVFRGCCGSARWARQMAARRPFATPADLYAAADAAWWALGAEDWRVAFAQHPRIGDVGALREKFGQSAAWSSQEQAGVGGAPEDVLAALAEGNRAYEDRFGYLFIVCATGKTAGEMLEVLEQRLGNAPAEELREAAEQQRQITRLRLEKWLDG